MSHSNCNHDHEHDHDHGHSHIHDNKSSFKMNDQPVESDPNEVVKDRQSIITSLFNAIRYGLKAQVSSILVENQDIVNELDSNGCSVIHWAAKRGDVEMLQILCEFGANISIVSTTDAKMRPIHWAASDGKVNSVSYLLSRKEDINTQDGNGCTPVIIATQHNYHQCVAFLIKNGADMSLRDSNGDTALHWAAYKGYVEMVGMLVHLTPRDLDSVDTFGQTPLHLAALRGNSDVVEYLARECNADTRVKDRNGNTPLDLSIKKTQLKSEWVLRRIAAPSCLGLLRSLSTEKLKDQRVLKYLFCGFDDKEVGAWPWRVVFLSNFVASLVTIVFAMDVTLADMYYLHLINTMTQVLWWIMFTMCLLKSPSFVSDLPATNPNGTKNPYTYDDVLTEYGKRDTLAGFEELPAICHSCHVCKPIRSKHCKISRRCINKFDHFCPFVFNTVCRDNYKFFIGLLIMHVIAGAAWYVTVGIFWSRFPISWMFFFYIIYSMGWFLMILMLLSYHMDLIRQNLTTNEHIKLGSYPYLKNGNFYDNPFDKKDFLLNFMDAIFPSTKVFYNRNDYLRDMHNNSNISNHQRRAISSSNDGDESKESLLEAGIANKSYCC